MKNDKRPTTNDQRQKGVTLIEMAVVISIVFFLAVVSIVEFGSMDDKAVRNGALVSAKAIGSALVMYQVDRNNQGFTCAMDRLTSYVNLTSVKASFTSVEIKTDDCTDFNPFTYLYISGTVKGIQPSYIVNYHLEPVKDPECSNGGVTPYPCKDKW